MILRVKWAQCFWHEEPGSTESHEDTYCNVEQELQDFLRALPRGSYRLTVEAIESMDE